MPRIASSLLFILFFISANADELTDNLFAALQQRNITAEALTQALQSQIEEDVRLALRVLGNIGGEASRASLLAKLKDDLPSVRTQAAKMIILAKLSDVESELIQARRNESNSGA